MLTEGEFRALTALHGEQTVSGLATQLDRSLSYTSELVGRLETTGLVETRREGKPKQVRPSDAKALIVHLGNGAYDTLSEGGPYLAVELDALDLERQ